MKVCRDIPFPQIKCHGKGENRNAVALVRVRRPAYMDARYRQERLFVSWFNLEGLNCQSDYRATMRATTEPSYSRVGEKPVRPNLSQEHLNQTRVMLYREDGQKGRGIELLGLVFTAMKLDGMQESILT